MDKTEIGLNCDSPITTAEQQRDGIDKSGRQMADNSVRKGCYIGGLEKLPSLGEAERLILQLERRSLAVSP